MSGWFWVALVFLVIGGYMIKVAYDYDFGSKQDTQNFVARFGRWVLHLGGNVIGLATYAAQQEWLPEVNQTNTSRG